MNRRGKIHNVGLLVLTLAGCAGTKPARELQSPTPASRCELPEPTVVRREGSALLQVWELPSTSVLLGMTLPEAPGYVAYRAAIRAGAGDLRRPVADPPQPKDEAERERWRRENANADLTYGAGGEVRQVWCIEAALFARQDARYSELTHPTEFMAHLLRRGDRLKIYLGAGDQMFPPKSVYGIDEVTADVATGWEYWVVLHNHTVRALNGTPALGIPAPSTSDVELFRGLFEKLHLREVWVTNGMYTGVVRAENLGRFRTPD